MNTTTLTEKQLRKLFRKALKIFRKKYGLFDQHTHTMPSVCGPQFCLRGPDAMIDYHYAYGEYQSENWMDDTEAAAFWQLPQRERVDRIIEHLFGRGALPVSEASLGILTAANALGLPTASGNMKKVLKQWRALYRDLGDAEYADRIFALSGITHVVSTQSPFVEAECDIYLDDAKLAQWDPRYQCGLRFDEFIYKPEILPKLCEKMGFAEAAGDLTQEKTQTAARKLLEFWIDRLPDVRYPAVSMPGSVDFKDKSSRIMLVLEKVLLPVAKERGLPLYLMPFVRRQINPLHKNAGDVVQRGDINGLIDWIAQHRDVMFCITPLHEGDNYDLAFATRALGNIRVWGHWWGNLHKVLVVEQLKLRLQMNGYAHFGFNSDARIDDQLLFKWPLYFEAMEDVIVERCLDIQRSGWPVTEEQMLESIRLLQDPDRIFSLAS